MGWVRGNLRNDTETSQNQPELQKGAPSHPFSGFFFVGSLLCGTHIVRKSQRDNLITKIAAISENIFLHGNPPAAV